jgi:hypothetical protein
MIKGLPHTSRWIAELEGEFTQADIKVVPEGKHELPAEILKTVKDAWEAKVADAKVSLANEFAESDIVQEPVNGLSRLYVMADGRKTPRLFAGSMVRLNRFFVRDKKLTLHLGETNYAELMATNNKNPFEILERYGAEGLADPVNVSVAISIRDGDAPMLFTFDRGYGLGEYSSRGESRDETLEICVAGGLSPDTMHPHASALRESYEEARIITVDDARALKKAGTIRKDARVRQITSSGSTRVALITDKSGEYRVAFMTYRSPICTGIITNVDPFDIDTQGKPTSHFRPEFLYDWDTGIQREDIEGTWTRAREHKGINFIPFTEDGLGAYLLDRYENLLPPGHAALAYAGKRKFGDGWFKAVIKDTNKKSPIATNHPYFSKL